MTEPQVHKQRRWQQIEVFGSMEKRMWSEGVGEDGRNKLRGDQSYLKQSEPELYALEDVKGPKKPAKRVYINKPNCPVRNPYDNIDGIMREEGIKLFDNLLWQQWHEDGQMPKSAKEWFTARVKEYKKGNDIDLVCNCRRFRGNDDDVGLRSKFQCDCHGYTLKNYIEFLAKEV